MIKVPEIHRRGYLINKKEKKMEEIQEDKGINLFGKNYKDGDLTGKQKALINHIGDIDGRLRQAQFDVDQLSFCKISFLKELEDELNGKDKKDKEKNSTKKK